METNQILRIPVKYGQLLEAISDEDCGKLMKAIFTGNTENIDGLIETYYGLIMTDIGNIENMVKKGKEGGKKGGRPRKVKSENTEEKTPPFSEKNPNKDKIRKDKIKEDTIVNSIDTTIEIVETQKKEEIIEGEIIENSTDEENINNNNTEISLVNSNGDIFKTIDNETILKKYEINEEELNDEIENFKNFWTAIVRKGKKQDIGKQLWETKETFSPALRFATWLTKNKQRKKRDLKTKPSGIGVIS